MQKKKQEIMNTRTTTRITRLSVVLLTSSVLLFAGMGYYNIAGVVNKAYAQDISTTDSDFQVTRPTADLTRDWWQWVLSIPADENPLTDRTGEQCDQGDFGYTFFLVGTLGGRAVRDCTVTEGQELLIPISNTICVKTEEEETEESLSADCAEITAQTRNLRLIIDRNQVRNLEDNRVTNPTFFEIVLPENNLFGAPAGSYQAVADGYWALIEGLSAGEHTITVIGVSGGPTWHSNVRVTYHLTVEEATDEAATDEEEALAIDEEVQEEQQPAEEEEEEGEDGDNGDNGGGGDVPDGEEG